MRSTLRISPNKVFFGGTALVALSLTVGSCTTDEPEAEESNAPTDISCVAEDLGQDDATEIVTAYYVIDGELADPCLGDGHPTVERAWQILADLTPPEQLGDLALFAGFESLEAGDEVTLAYVNSVDFNSLFQMSVNITEADIEESELALTLAHEFSHVFTATSPELDRDASAEDCSTYWNGEGCYVEGGVLANWIDEFWWPDLIEQVDPEAEVSVADGQGRCDLDPQFFGAYAATNPEEDFAETFSAFVLQVPANSDAQQAKLDWIESRPGLVEFRDRAVAAGYGPVDHNFDPCGP